MRNLVENLKQKSTKPVAAGLAVLGLAGCGLVNQEETKPETYSSSSMSPSEMLDYFKAEADNFADCTPEQMPFDLLELNQQTTDSLTEYGKELSDAEVQNSLENLVQTNIGHIRSVSELLTSNAGGETQLAYAPEYGRVVLQVATDKRVTIYSLQQDEKETNDFCLAYKIDLDIADGSSANISFKMGAENSGEYIAKGGSIATKITPESAATMTVIVADLRAVVPESADITVLPGGSAPDVSA